MTKLDSVIYAMLRDRTLAKAKGAGRSPTPAYVELWERGAALFNTGQANSTWEGVQRYGAAHPDLRDAAAEELVTGTALQKQETPMTADAELTILTKAYKDQHPDASELQVLNAVVKERPDLWARVRREGADVPLAKAHVPKTLPPPHPALVAFEKMVSALELHGFSKRQAEDRIMRTEEGQQLYAQYRRDYGR